MKQKKLLLILCILISLPSYFTGCASLKVPNTEICAVKGKLHDGMICATTLSDKQRELDFEEAFEFLHATEEHGAALCQTSKDWTKIKNAIESACSLLGDRCKKKRGNDVLSLVNAIENVQSLSGTNIKED